MEKKIDKKIDYKVWTREEKEKMNKKAVKENLPKSKPVNLEYDENDLLL